MSFLCCLTFPKLEDFLLVSTPRTSAATGSCTGSASLDRSKCVPSFQVGKLYETVDVGLLVVAVTPWNKSVTTLVMK